MDEAKKVGAEERDVADEAQQMPSLAWMLVAVATEDAFDGLSALIEPVLEDTEPLCSQYAELMRQMAADHAPERDRSQTRLPHLTTNHWDNELQMLLCYDREQRLAELWQKREVG